MKKGTLNVFVLGTPDQVLEQHMHVTDVLMTLTGFPTLVVVVEDPVCYISEFLEVQLALVEGAAYRLYE